MAKKSRPRSWDRAIADRATRQHGVVSTKQLQAMGLSHCAIATRAAAGRLHRVHHSVYAVGHSLLSVQGRWLAAVLTLGDGAVLSHRSAAAAHHLIQIPSGNPDVLVPRKVKPRAGITVRRTTVLPAEHVTVVDGCPCTTVSRTLVDLAGVVPPRVLERAIGQAEVLQVFDRVAIERAMEVLPRRPGIGTLRALITREDLASTLTRSHLEELLIALCDRYDLPRPMCSVPYVLPDGTPIEIDALYPDAALAIELDGRRFHDTVTARAADNRRDNLLTLAGLRPIRFRKPDLAGDAPKTAALLRGLLSGAHART
jgi:hypothetical protein